MANSLVERRQTDSVDGDTTCPHEAAPRAYVPNRAHLQTTVANALRGGPPAPAEGGAVGDAYPVLDALPFGQIWAVDFEFDAKPGENPEPLCLVAGELRSGRKVRLWRDAFGDTPPYPNGPDVLFVAYYASAEIGCHFALGWPAPERVLDLFTEFRNHTNGMHTICGAGLLGALAHYGLDSIGTGEKDEMRDLILRGGPWADDERNAILTYCESDVAGLARLLPAMLPNIDISRALLRGRYMVAAAQIERNGVPIDTETLGYLNRYWSDIQDQLIADIDTNYGVYEGRTFIIAYIDWEQQEFRYSGGTVRRLPDEGCLSFRRSLPRLCQTGRRRTTERNQSNPQGGPRSVQGVRVGGAIRDGC